jgi:transposase
VRERQPGKLGEWVAAAVASGIEEMTHFGVGLRRDWEAVVAGLTLPWSNGPVEGQVNRLKLLKRQMFGRAGLPLLRVRVLPLRVAA